MISVEQAFPNRIAGVIRTDDGDAAYRACRAAIEGGVGTVEVTTGVPGWVEVVERLVAASPGVPIGVGTVVRPEMVGAAVAAGATFVVTPFLLPEVAAAAQGAGRPARDGRAHPERDPPGAQGPRRAGREDLSHLVRRRPLLPEADRGPDAGHAALGERGS